MKVRPLHDRLLVERIDEDDKTKGGIIIPDTAKEKPMQGKVIAAGAGKVSDEGKVIPMDVKKGDKVLFGKYAGTEFQLDGRERRDRRFDRRRQGEVGQGQLRLQRLDRGVRRPDEGGRDRYDQGGPRRAPERGERGDAAAYYGGRGGREAREEKGNAGCTRHG